MSLQLIGVCIIALTAGVIATMAAISARRLYKKMKAPKDSDPNHDKDSSEVKCTVPGHLKPRVHHQ